MMDLKPFDFQNSQQVKERAIEITQKFARQLGAALSEATAQELIEEYANRVAKAELRLAQAVSENSPHKIALSKEALEELAFGGELIPEIAEQFTEKKVFDAFKEIASSVVGFLISALLKAT